MDSFRSESSSMLRLQRVVSLMRKDEKLFDLSQVYERQAIYWFPVTRDYIKIFSSSLPAPSS